MKMKRKITILLREGCHLCEEAYWALLQVAENIPLEIETIDIDADPVLYSQYENDIPVIFLDGKEIGRHRIQRKSMVRAIENI